MVTRSEELATVDSWEAIWAKTNANTASSRLKRRLRSSRSWQAMLADLLDSPGKSGPVRVLELGCAPGQMLLDLHALRPRNEYSGIDYAPNGIRIAAAALRAAGVEAELHVGDIRWAELPPVDLVMSFGLVEHFEHPAEAMVHHRRFLGPGGTVAVTVPNYAHPAVVALIKRFSPETLATHNLDVMSTRALHDALATAGFTGIRTGGCGGPILPNSRPRPGLGGRVYRTAARSWNVAAGALPERWPWPAVLWATGVSQG